VCVCVWSQICSCECLTACAAKDPIRAACLTAANPISSGSSDGTNPAMIGGIVAGVAVVAIGGGVAVWLYSRRRAEQAKLAATKKDKHSGKHGDKKDKYDLTKHGTLTRPKLNRHCVDTYSAVTSPTLQQLRISACKRNFD
jgi:hypothetical protein